MKLTGELSFNYREKPGHFSIFSKGNSYNINSVLDTMLMSNKVKVKISKQGKTLCDEVGKLYSCRDEDRYEKGKLRLLGVYPKKRLHSKFYKYLINNTYICNILWGLTGDLITIEINNKEKRGEKF